MADNRERVGHEAPSLDMADKIEMIPMDQLNPYPRNARTHSDAQIAQIVASMTEFGWTNPVLVDAKGTIVAGHGRVLAARNMTTSSPTSMPAGS